MEQATSTESGAAPRVPPSVMTNDGGVQDAFHVLGLAPDAGGWLIEIAYWALVEENRRAVDRTPRERRLRLEEVNRARATALRALRPAVVEQRPRRTPIVLPAGLVGMVLALLLAAPAALILWLAPSGSSWRGPLAAGATVALGAVLGFGTWWLRRKRGEGTPSPYTVLHLDPVAPGAVVEDVYRALRLSAEARGAVMDVASLEAARRRLLANSGPTLMPSTAIGPRRRWRSAFRVPRLPRVGAHGKVPAPPDRAAAAHVDPVRDHSAGLISVYHNGATVATLQLNDGQVYLLGASAQCDLKLEPAPGLGAEHARLQVRRGRVRYHHCDASSESLCEGQRVTVALLEEGDEIVVGPYRCRFTSALPVTRLDSSVQSNSYEQWSPTV